MKILTTHWKKIMLIVGILLGVLFLTYQIVFSIQKNTMEEYSDGFSEIHKNRTYIYEDKENQLIFNVKYPDYFTLGGNLAVATKDNKYALLVWPKVYGETKVGFQSNIMTPESRSDSYLSVSDGEIQCQGAELLEDDKEMIKFLEEQAKKIWGKDVFK